MLDTPTLTKALVGAEASSSVAAVKYRVPSADEKAVQIEIDHEVGRIEQKLSVMLAHIEGHYESQVANMKLKLKLSTQKSWVLPLVAVFGIVIGFVLGRIV